MPPAAHALPDYGTPFVGREADLERIDAAVASGATLVTLVGPGGVGKTRLAVEHARGSAGELPVAFCELTPTRTAEDVAGAMVAALSLMAEAGPAHADSATRVGLSLARLGRAVIVVNNAEHVIAAAPFTLGVWRVLAPDVRFVVTSRTPLGLPGEVVVPVGPLDTGGRDAAAVRLLEVRLPAGLVLAPSEADAAAELVRRLGGQPLAIELVAAHVDVVSPRAMLDDYLAASYSDAPPTALEWAWSLLRPDEQEALRQLSAFAGSFTRAAAAAVVRLPDGAAVDPVIDSLVRKRLLVRLAEGSDRLSCVESMREHGEIELFASPDDVAAVHARHREHFLELAAGWVEALHGPEGLSALAALAAEHDNLRAVLRRVLDHRPRDRRDVEIALRAVLGLHPVLALRSPLAVQIGVLDEVVHACAPFPEVARGAVFARLLHDRGYAYRYRGRMDDCVRDLDRALELARALDDRALLAQSLVTRSAVHGLRGQPEAELGMLDEALALARADGLRRLEGVACSARGVNAVRRGALDEARRLLDEALAIVREVGDRRFEGIVLTQRGALALEQNRVDEAVSSFEAALAVHGEVGNRRFEATTLGNLCIARHLLGRLDEARAGYRDALARLEHLGERRFHAYYLGYLGLLDLEQGRLPEARLGLSRALSELRSLDDPRYEGITTAALAGERTQAGDPDEARALLDEAREVLAEAGDPLIVPLVEVYEGLLEVAEATGAETDPARRAELLARASGRAGRLSTVPADDVRLANRALVGALSAAGVTVEVPEPAPKLKGIAKAETAARPKGAKAKAKKAPAKKAAVKKAPAKKTTAKKTPATAKKKAPAKKPVKKTPVKKTPVKKTPVKKAPAKKAPATAKKKAPVKKTPATAKKKAPVKKTPAKKAPGRTKAPVKTQAKRGAVAKMAPAGGRRTPRRKA